MKIRRISRRSPAALRVADDRAPVRRVDFVRTIVAVTLAIALIGTGAVALPSLSPVRTIIEIPPPKGPQLEPDELAAIESIHETAANLARATTAVTRPIADGIGVIPDAANMVRATAHEAIKMKKGIIPLIPSKFA